MKTKPAVLRSFKISNDEIDKKESDLSKKLRDKLKITKAKDRVILLSENDPLQDSDLICDFNAPLENRISGTMLRVTKSSDIPKIPNNYFEDQKIIISKLESLDLDTDFSYKGHFYFFMNGRYLITNLQGNTTIKSFQEYINKLLEKERDQKIYEFTPLTKIPDNIQFKDLKTIKVQDPNTSQNDGVNSESQKKLFDIPKELLEYLFSDVKNLNQIDLERVISAELYIKFKKPKSMTKDEYENFLGSYLKPISDVENVSIVPKKGPSIKGSEMLRTKVVQIELTESGKYSEIGIFQEMEKFLKDIENENN